MSRYRNIFLFFFVLLIAIFLRVVLVNWTLQFWNNGDLVRYEDWARVAHVYSLSDTYSTLHMKLPNNQPPGTLYLLTGTYETYILTGKIIAKLTHTTAGSNVWVNIILETIFMKGLSIITDLLMGICAYLLVAKKMGYKRGIFAASLIWFNPVIFYNSAIWGQTDSLNNFFFVLSLFFAFKNRYFLSIASFMFSIFIKFSLLPLLPFYAVFLFFLSGKKWKLLLIELAITLIISLVILLPIDKNPVLWIIREAPIIARGEYQNIVIAAYNFWWAATCLPVICKNNIPTVNQIFLFIPLGIWAYILFAISTIPILYLQIKKYKILLSEKNIFLVFAVIALCIFLFFPRMHDRYMYPVFPFLAIAIGFSKPMKWYIIIFTALIILHMFNLLGSWYPTYFPAFIFYQILYSSLLRWLVSILTVIAASLLYIKTLKMALGR